MDFKTTILCIGAGYVGGPTMSVIAKNCPDIKIIVADINAQKIEAWNSDNLPVKEPHLLEIVKKQRNKNLFFTTDIPSAIVEADIVFISVNTPTKTFGNGAGKASNLEYVEKTAREILKYANSDKVIVEKSTLPIRCAETIKKILKSNGTKFNFEVISNPEFLSEGSAINDLQNPDRILIGAENTPKAIEAREKVADIYRYWVKEEQIKFSNLWSSELTKLAANAMLAQRISSVNSLSALCEKTGANIEEVAQSIGLDSRIGSKFLKAGIGFGGSCFQKDILNLVYLCEYYNLPEVAKYWENVILINNYQQVRFVDNITKIMFNSLVGKKIAIFGFAFKANTNDTRETPALKVCELLLEEHANLSIYDPWAMENCKKDLANFQGIEYCNDPYVASKDAHAIVVLTDWEEFKTLDYKKIYQSMTKPAYVFDGRNILNLENLYKIGFNVSSIGNVSLSHLE